MWFRRLSLFGLWGSMILSCTSSNHCLWVFTLPPILFCFLPFSLPSLSGKWRSGSITSSSAQVFCHRVAQPVPLTLLIESWLLWMLHLPQDVILSIEIPGGSTLLPGWFSQKPPGKPQERKLQSKQKSTRDHDYTSITCIPAWVQPRPPKWCFASLSWFSSDDVLEVSVARDSRVKVVEFPLKHLTAGFIDGTHLISTCLLTTQVEGQPQPLGPSNKFLTLRCRLRDRQGLWCSESLTYWTWVISQGNNLTLFFLGL